MIDKISAFSQAFGVSPLKRNRTSDRIPAERESAVESRDKTEFSHPKNEASEVQRNGSASSASNISESDQHLTASQWYRYGMPQAYQALEP
ncbi:MAG: hypothetical protein HQ591_13165 [candidate division Zixibacteria bacterium]|nr:hypothetical protein [Candidatus Tariuqbacter arcticus]